MKIINLLLAASLCSSFAIIFSCRSSNAEVYQEPKEAFLQNSKVPIASKWDNGFSKKQEGDDIGWFQTPDGIWIDTMRDEQHKYSSYPPHFNNKTYYPNFTVEFPDVTEGQVDIQEFFDIAVKDLDQNFIKKVNPFTDSKQQSLQSINNVKVMDMNARYAYATIEQAENSQLDFDQIAIDIKQHGDVLISQISTWKARTTIKLDEINTETIIYSDEGKILYQKNRQGSIAAVQVSKNQKFVVESWGGPYSEDTTYPYQCSIYNLDSKTIYWKANSLKNCISIGIVDGSDFAMISNVIDCQSKDPNNELIAMDLSESKMYQFSSKDKVNATKVRINEDLELYYNTKDGKVMLDLDTDFKQIKNLP